MLIQRNQLTLDTSPPSTSNFIAESFRPESATLVLLAVEEVCTWLLLAEEEPPGAGRLVPTTGKLEEEGWEEEEFLT